jgi:acyl-CoA thioester hydrolase
MSKENGSHPAIGEARVRVRYAETDQMGVVYHANYLVWFEVGRVELMRQIGLDYKRLEIDEGCWIAVVEATARYKALLCEGETVHVAIGPDMKRRPMPKKYAELLGAAASHILSEISDGDGTR